MDLTAMNSSSMTETQTTARVPSRAKLCVSAKSGPRKAGSAVTLQRRCGHAAGGGSWCRRAIFPVTQARGHPKGRWALRGNIGVPQQCPGWSSAADTPPQGAGNTFPLAGSPLRSESLPTFQEPGRTVGWPPGPGRKDNRILGPAAPAASRRQWGSISQLPGADGGTTVWLSSC